MEKQMANQVDKMVMLHMDRITCWQLLAWYNYSGTNYKHTHWLFWYEDDKGKGIKKHFNGQAEPTGPIGHEPSLHCGMPNTQHVDTITRCRENAQSCLVILFLFGGLKKIWCSVADNGD
jgi:hypothetical protein